MVGCQRIRFYNEKQPHWLPIHGPYLHHAPQGPEIAVIQLPAQLWPPHRAALAVPALRQCRAALGGLLVLLGAALGAQVPPAPSPTLDAVPAANARHTPADQPRRQARGQILSCKPGAPHTEGQGWAAARLE